MKKTEIEWKFDEIVAFAEVDRYTRETILAGCITAGFRGGCAS